MADQYGVCLPPRVIRSPIQDPQGKVCGHGESHRMKWPGLVQTVEIIFEETKTNWGEWSQIPPGNTGLRYPAVINKCKKLKTGQTASWDCRDIKKSACIYLEAKRSRFPVLKH